jgi:hypothetical protein
MPEIEASKVPSLVPAGDVWASTASTRYSPEGAWASWVSDCVCLSDCEEDKKLLQTEAADDDGLPELTLLDDCEKA